MLLLKLILLLQIKPNTLVLYYIKIFIELFNNPLLKIITNNNINNNTNNNIDNNIDNNINNRANMSNMLNNIYINFIFKYKIDFFFI
jgi:hypothetical protein